MAGARELLMKPEGFEDTEQGGFSRNFFEFKTVQKLALAWVSFASRLTGRSPAERLALIGSGTGAKHWGEAFLRNA